MKQVRLLRYSSGLSAAYRTTVSFLDDLKRRADALKQQHDSDAAGMAERTALTESACRAVFSYFVALVPQLNVLCPTSPARFALDRQHVFEGLKLSDFRMDSRRKRLRNDEVFDHLVIQWHARSGRTLALTKDFPPDMEQLEARLRQGGVTLDQEVLRQPDSGKLLGHRYRFVADFAGAVVVVPNHDDARISFQVRNLDGLESLSVEFAATDVATARLDELARWIAGESHDFLAGGMNLRRVVT